MQSGNRCFDNRAPRRKSGALLCVTMLFAGAAIGATPLPGPGRVEPPPETLSTPLHFKRHNFQAFCYNAIGCHVLYDGHNFSPAHAGENPGDYISPPPRDSDYRQQWLGRSYVDIPNFPGPVQVRWRSLDGRKHEAAIDLAAIFKDELVWHDVSAEDIAHFFEGPTAGSPDIFLEVNDRTVSVYMTMFIPTKKEQVAGNPYSAFRNDILLAWTQTY